MENDKFNTRESAANIEKAIEDAFLSAKDASTADELRRVMAVTLTLHHKLTLKEVSKLVGRSASWVALARADFIDKRKTKRSSTHGGRRNQLMTIEEEDAFMDAICNEHMRLLRESWQQGSALFDRPRTEISIHQLTKKSLSELKKSKISTSEVSRFMTRIGKRVLKREGFRNWDAYAWGKKSQT